MIHDFQKIGRHMEKQRSVPFLIFEGKAFPCLALRCSPPLRLRGYMQNDASHIKAYQCFAYTPLKSPVWTIKKGTDLVLRVFSEALEKLAARDKKN